MRFIRTGWNNWKVRILKVEIGELVDGHAGLLHIFSFFGLYSIGSLLDGVSSVGEESVNLNGWTKSHFTGVKQRREDYSWSLAFVTMDDSFSVVWDDLNGPGDFISENNE